MTRVIRIFVKYISVVSAKNVPWHGPIYILIKHNFVKIERDVKQNLIILI